MCFGNNWVGLEVLRWLRQQEFDIVALVLHPLERQTYGNEISLQSGVPNENIFWGDQLSENKVLDQIRELKPDIGLSIFFDYILNQNLLSIFRDGCLNLHPSYLPFNGGQYPNVWSIVEGTPAGDTMHYMDSGIDTGDIIAQRTIPVEPIETGQSLYRKLELNCVELFSQTWLTIIAGQVHPVSQSPGEGTKHKRADVDKIDRINLDHTYQAKDLINVIRARTFPPHRGAYI